MGSQVVFRDLSALTTPSVVSLPTSPPHPGVFSLPTAMDFPQHSQQVLEQLNQQRQLGLLCDCTFVVDGIDFKAHKAVLAACSDYFRMLFVDQKDVVHLDISNAAGRPGIFIQDFSQLLKQ